MYTRRQTKGETDGHVYLSRQTEGERVRLRGRDQQMSRSGQSKLPNRIGGKSNRKNQFRYQTSKMIDTYQMTEKIVAKTSDGHWSAVPDAPE